MIFNYRNATEYVSYSASSQKRRVGIAPSGLALKHMQGRSHGGRLGKLPPPCLKRFVYIKLFKNICEKHNVRHMVKKKLGVSL